MTIRSGLGLLALAIAPTVSASGASAQSADAVKARFVGDYELVQEESNGDWEKDIEQMLEEEPQADLK